jgi:hypothetical protein
LQIQLRAVADKEDECKDKNYMRKTLGYLQGTNWKKREKESGME